MDIGESIEDGDDAGRGRTGLGRTREQL